jgi:hypothetical protein
MILPTYPASRRTLLLQLHTVTSIAIGVFGASPGSENRRTHQRQRHCGGGAAFDGRFGEDGGCVLVPESRRFVREKVGPGGWRIC